MNRLEIAKAYLRSIESMGDCADLHRFLAPDIVQTEYPNKITPNGAKRDLATILAGCEQGKAIMAAQRYEILREFVSGETVILEINWSGTLKIAVGEWEAGDVMRARFAVFLRFEDGKIVEQRNYDCFD